MKLAKACKYGEGDEIRPSPDSEGWWWYLPHDADTSDAIVVEVYIHGGRVEAWQGRTKLITSHFAKWQKVTAPHWPND